MEQYMDSALTLNACIYYIEFVSKSLQLVVGFPSNWLMIQFSCDNSRKFRIENKVSLYFPSTEFQLVTRLFYSLAQGDVCRQLMCHSSC